MRHGQVPDPIVFSLRQEGSAIELRSPAVPRATLLEVVPNLPVIAQCEDVNRTIVRVNRRWTGRERAILEALKVAPRFSVPNAAPDVPVLTSSNDVQLSVSCECRCRPGRERSVAGLGRPVRPT